MSMSLSEQERMVRNFLQRHKNCTADQHVDHINDPTTYLGEKKKRKRRAAVQS